MTSLLTLPPELLMDLAEHTVIRIPHDRPERWRAFADKEDLRMVMSLSLACKALHQACIPTLLYRVVLVPRSNNFALLHFLEALIRRPNIARHVRILACATNAIEPARVDGKWLKKAVVILQKDPTATQMLRSGKMGLSNLIAIRILQCLSNLTWLAVEGKMLQVEHWPEEKRLLGRNLVSLAICSNGNSRGPHSTCAGPLGWSQSFRPTQKPTSLRYLFDCHQCSEHDSCYFAPITKEWEETYAPSLQAIAFDWVPCKDLSRLLEPCQHLTSLALNPIQGPCRDVIQTIAKLTALAANLDFLSIGVRAADQMRGMDGNSVLGNFSAFPRLYTLTLPMPIEGSDVYPAARLPPTLRHLVIAWTLPAPNEYLEQGFMIFLGGAVRAGQMPPSLTDIVLQWPDDATRVEYLSMPIDAISVDDVEHLNLRIVTVDTICQSKSITLWNRIGEGGDPLSTDQWTST